MKLYIATGEGRTRCALFAREMKSMLCAETVAEIAGELDEVAQAGSLGG
jgi:hypothetical protein